MTNPLSQVSRSIQLHSARGSINRCNAILPSRSQKVKGLRTITAKSTKQHLVALFFPTLSHFATAIAMPTFQLSVVQAKIRKYRFELSQRWKSIQSRRTRLKLVRPMWPPVLEAGTETGSPNDRRPTMCLVCRRGHRTTIRTTSME